MYVLLNFATLNSYECIFLFQNEKYRVTAYDSVVTIVEPEPSWFDYQLYE